MSVLILTLPFYSSLSPIASTLPDQVKIHHALAHSLLRWQARDKRVLSQKLLCKSFPAVLGTTFHSSIATPTKFLLASKGDKKTETIPTVLRANLPLITPSQMSMQPKHGDKTSCFIPPQFSSDVKRSKANLMPFPPRSKFLPPNLPTLPFNDSHNPIFSWLTNSLHLQINPFPV